jgi:hypothetical protein
MNGHGQARQAGASDWLLSALKQNPEGLLLLAAGCALLLRKSSSSSGVWSGSGASAASHDRGGMRRTAEGAQDYVEGAKRYARDFAEQTKGAAGESADSVAEYAGQLRQTVGRQSGRAVEQVRSTARSALDRVLQEQPLVVAVAGLAAGAALAATLPATEIEEQTLGPVGEQMTDAARRVGDQVKEAAGAAGDKLKGVAEERGLTPEGMKQLAKDVSGAFTDSMSGGSQQGAGGSQQGSGGAQQGSGGNLAGPRGPSGSGRPY